MERVLSLVALNIELCLVSELLGVRAISDEVAPAALACDFHHAATWTANRAFATHSSIYWHLYNYNLQNPFQSKLNPLDLNDQKKRFAFSDRDLLRYR